jgi:histidyl-tRNA synthetase
LSNRFQSVRGMHDILPDSAPSWQRVEGTLIDVLRRHGYREMRFPVVEHAELFERSIGETTDIVSKEMYTFTDRNGERLTLRPEGTAGCARAVIEHGLLQGGPLRVWYMGPMFRREKPQQGRFRQFHQIGAEVFGMPGPDIDAELITMTARMWKELGIPKLRLEVNSLGDVSARGRYRDALVDYFGGHRDKLDADSIERLEKNPLRILDSKERSMQKLIGAAPTLETFLDEDSARHFAGLRSLLDAAGVAHVVNPRLVRGLDYYSGTVFEWISGDLGAQGAICAGGRYDGLVEHFGGKPTPGAGFAMGLERILALAGGDAGAEPAPQVYVVVSGDDVLGPALRLVEKLRDQLPRLRLTMHCGGGSFKSQFKKADRSGAAVALVLGVDEIRNGTVGIKPLREESEQTAVPADSLAAELARRFPD